MAKSIEETFSIKIGDYNFHVIARNYNEHKFQYMVGTEIVSACLNTAQMRTLANHLNEIASTIDADPLFKR